MVAEEPGVLEVFCFRYLINKFFKEIPSITPIEEVPITKEAVTVAVWHLY